MKYRVLLTTHIEIVADGDTPEDAARSARTRILGMLCEMPTECISLGFMPDGHWQVRTCDQEQPLKRAGEIVASGVDNDLDPR